MKYFLLITTLLLPSTLAQLGQASFKSCIDANYEYREDLDACVPMCKIGEKLDEDFYCVEMVFIKAKPDFI